MIETILGLVRTWIGPKVRYKYTFMPISGDYLKAVRKRALHRVGFHLIFLECPHDRLKRVRVAGPRAQPCNLTQCSHVV